MDVQGSRSGSRGENEPGESDAPRRTRLLRSEDVGRRLGEWQASELRLARAYPECRDLGQAQLEDIYQDTVIVLLARPHHDEQHLRNALRWGLKRRALQLHRNERRRGEILDQRGPELEEAAERRELQRAPELALVLAEDRLVVSEFLTELSELEQRVFWLAAEGMRYRAIAPVLEIPVNIARKAFRSCERKRAHFQLLYDTGRLCGYRSRTIRAMKSGGAVSEQLTLGAYAHLESCARCRAEHKTNRRQLRRSFQGQAAALLPIPLLTGRLGLLARLDLRARTIGQRVGIYGTPPSGGAVRERGVALLLSGGAGAKIAAAGATAVVIAGSTIGASGVLTPTHKPRRHAHHARAAASSASTTERSTAASAGETSQAASSNSSDAAGSSSRTSRGGQRSREPGGFAFLGVAGKQGTARRAARASAASAGPRPARPSSAPHKEPTQSGGGAFSP